MLIRLYLHFLFTIFFYSFSSLTSAQQVRESVKLIPAGEGWANNSINAVVFRKNSLVSFKDTQYIAFYDAQQHVVLGKRKIGATQWQLRQTPYKGNTADAHNTISIMVDGDGYLHVAWDHHNNALRYCRSVLPGSLELTPRMAMTGKVENRVSYPEFYRLPDGNLLFFYRDGGSGQGNLVINKYITSSKQWVQLHTNLIDGEGKRNAYWQAYVDAKGIIYISWVWRESPDVASNHDLCYARSLDGGVTWQKSNGEVYTLPINASTAEYALKIPQQSELINQTSMAADEKGNPFIASYWREAGSLIPQYHIVYYSGKQWYSLCLNFRKTAFSLSGSGSKRIPIARPQVMVKGIGQKASALLIFRDEERGNKVSVAAIKKMKKEKWTIRDLTTASVGSWEPSYDTELWKKEHRLNLFIQNVEQTDGEGLTNIPPQAVNVLEWNFKF